VGEARLTCGQASRQLTSYQVSAKREDLTQSDQAKRPDAIMAGMFYQARGLSFGLICLAWCLCDPGRCWTS
jgi:hypothetical protein